MPCRVVDNANKSDIETMDAKVEVVVTPTMVRVVLDNDDMVLDFNSYAEANHYSYQIVSVRVRDLTYTDSPND